MILTQVESIAKCQDMFYDVQSHLGAVLFEPGLSSLWSVRERQHHSPFHLQDPAGQTPAIPLQSLRENILLHLEHPVLPTS
jgi:hypothetical protein